MSDVFERGNASLRPLFQPRHIAIIGASRTEGKSGHSVVRNLVRCGFAGRISPINPAGGAVEGLSCFPSIADVAEPVDCAMVVVPAAGAVEAVRACAAKQVRAVVIGSSGFAEANTEAGRAWQADLTRIARDSGMRLLGPNTNGFYNASDAVSLGYNAAHAEMAAAGSVSVVSHSGALFGAVLHSLRTLGADLAKFVPVGNEADIDMLDMLDFLIEDPATDVIGLIIEALSDGARLRQLAARAAAANKPIVALKVGRSAVGVGAALAHSSRLAGSARAYDALFSACGIAGVQSVEALAGGCAILAGRQPQEDRPHGAGDRRLIAVTTSGAGGALLADAATARAIPLAGTANGEWEGEVGRRIAALPSRGWLRNPIDMGSAVSWEQLTAIYAELETAGLDGPTAVYAHVAPSPAMDRQLVAALKARRSRTTTPIVLVAPGGLTPQIESDYRAGGIRVFHDTGSCFDSLACWYRPEPSVPPSYPDIPFSSDIAAKLTSAAASDQPFLSELDSAEILRQAGLPIVGSEQVRDADHAVSVAGKLGYPVVLKALAPGIAHKNDAGLVRVGITGEADLRDAFQRLEASLSALGAAGAGALFIMQPMLKGEAELILGVTSEAKLGHFLVIGIGGIHAELLDQVTLLPIPSGADAIRRALRPTPLGRLLKRLNRGENDNLDAVVAIAVALEALVSARGDQIDSIDINPVLVTRSGCFGVDALIVAKT